MYSWRGCSFDVDSNTLIGMTSRTWQGASVAIDSNTIDQSNPTQLNIWDGTQWVRAPYYVWDGSTWTQIS